MKLTEVMSQTPSGKWQHNRVFEDVSASVKMGIPPSQFWAYAESDRAFILAYFRAVGAMEAYENHLQALEMERASKRKH